MNEQQKLVAQTAEALFSELGPNATVAERWRDVEALALTSLLVAAEDGGFGGTWEDALIVFRLAGYHAVSLPIPEATIAASLAPAGTSGLGTIAVTSEGVVAGDRFSGRLRAAPWGRDADYVVAEIGDGLFLLPRARVVEPSGNPAGEPRDTLVYEDAQAIPLNDADLLALGALARSAQIAGALDAALSRSVAYANERSQFGRPLGKFQAVQQALASFAAEAAAVNCAAMGACQAATRGDAAFEIAAAKLRANMAVGVGTAVAHQVHGAIGFTEEYGLHPLTRRLWAWRSEFGGDAHWASLLGTIVARSGADTFWNDMVGRADPVEA